MGLDQYIYAINNNNGEKQEIYYWRKNYHLHKWIEDLYKSKHNRDIDIYDDIFLEEEDIEKFKNDVNNNMSGDINNFFGEYDQYDKNLDLEFIEIAYKYLNNNFQIYYSASW